MVLIFHERESIQNERAKMSEKFERVGTKRERINARASQSDGFSLLAKPRGKVDSGSSQEETGFWEFTTVSAAVTYDCSVMGT